MNLKKKKQLILKEKKEQLLGYKATEEYLLERIKEGEISRRETLNEIRKVMEEVERQIEFFRK